MATEKISLAYNKDKYAAIKKFAVKKHINIEDELTKTLDKLYLKTVPSAVREFIESEGNSDV